MTQKIALFGAPGSGKSTTAAHVFVLLKQRGINAEYVHEYAREEINKGWTQKHPAEQFRLIKHQREREDNLPESVEIMITDSPVFLMFFYALYHTQNIIQDKYNFISLYEDFINDLNRYDYIFFMVRDGEYVKDGTRYQTEEESDLTHTQLKALLDLHKVKYTEIKGNKQAAETILSIVYDK